MVGGGGEKGARGHPPPPPPDVLFCFVVFLHFFKMWIGYPIVFC